MDDLAKKLNFADKRDWYNISTKTIKEHGGRYLLYNMHKGSVLNILKSVYPEYLQKKTKISLKLVCYINICNYNRSSMVHSYYDHRTTWDAQNFVRKRKNFWGNVSNQKQFLDDLTKKLNITKEDLRNVPSSTIQKHGGNGLLGKYGGSTLKLLQTAYPEYSNKRNCNFFNVIRVNWTRDLVKKTGYWDDISNTKMTLEKIAKELNVNSVEDWLKVSQMSVHKHGGSAMLSTSGSLTKGTDAFFKSLKRYKFCVKFIQSTKNSAEL